jgi:Predicted hydrolase (HAD superfamily)
LFELALKKAHLKPEEVWFCGDHPKFDISGVSGAGIYPVWYQSELDCPYRQIEEEPKPDCNFLHIHDWKELIAVLQSME